MPDFNENSEAFFSMLSALGGQNLLGASKFPVDVYSPCWCGSNKKWKFCHKDREKKPKPIFGRTQLANEKFFLTGTCQHPDASSTTCSSIEAIQSHTVQRRGGLAAIAEGGHVYSIKRGMRDIGKNEGHVDMEKYGVGKASTFPGYCSHHDTILFKPVETAGAVLDDMNSFLLSLRAVSYEVATKEASLNAHIANRDSVDAGSSFEIQVAVQNFMALQQVGLERGLQDVKACKLKYDRAFISRDTKDFSFYGITFDGTLPFAAAGAFMPEFDFTGNRVQDILSDETTNIVAVNVTQLNGKTCAVFGWFGGRDCPAFSLVDSFKKLADEEKANALLLMCLEHLENVYFKPSWWDGLSADLSNRLHRNIAGGAPGTLRSSDAFVAPNLGALAFNICTTHEKMFGEDANV
jgi:hypothetical protein